MKRLVAELDDELHKEIKMEALRQGTSAKQLVIELIATYLKNKENERSEKR